MIAIRGAIDVSENTAQGIREAALTLWDEVVQVNDLSTQELISLHLSCTQDLDAAYPGKFIRLERNLTKISIMHSNEMKVVGQMPRVLRLEVLVERCNSKASQPVYLGKAKELRKDLQRFQEG